MSVNLHVVLNNFINDSRVLKETKSIASKYFDKIYIAALWEDGVDENELLDSKREVWRIRLISRWLPKNLFFQVFKYFEWIMKIYIRFRKEPISVVHCHDLSALPVGVVFKLLQKTKVIYDAHELETEQEVGYREIPSLRKRLSKWLERWLMKEVDAMITVSPSIQNWYVERFPVVPVNLVRNIPANLENPSVSYPLREQLEIPDNALLFLFIGMLGADRGIEIALASFQEQEVRHHLAFMGNGPLREKIEDVIHNCPRIHLLSPVPHKEVILYSNSADVGVCLNEDTCLSFRYSLPNKLFESLIGGIPVLASDLPDQAEIVRAYGAGWVVQNHSDSLVQFLKELTVEKAKQMRSGLKDRVKELSWDNEAKVLLHIYEKVLIRNINNKITISDAR